MGRHLWSLALLLTGTLHLAVAWTGWLAALVFVVALLVAYGVTSLAYRIGAPGWLASGATLTLTSLAAELVAARDGAPFGTAVRDAFPRLLTAPRPAPSDPDLLVPGVLLVVVLGVWAAVRQARPSGAPVAPVVSAVVLYVATALLTAGAADRHGLVAALLVVLATSGWSAGRGRAGATGLVPVLAVVGGAALLAPTVIATEDAFEPRELVAPPHLLLDEPSPLPRLAAWAQEADVELFTVATERPLPVRLVALTEFDGVTWRHPVAYRPFGAVATPDLPPGRRVADVSAEVTVTALTGPWAPSPGRPIATTLATAHVDGGSGTVAIPERLTDGLTYRIDATVDDARAVDVRDASVSTDPAVQPYLELPPMPTDLAELSRNVIRGASTPLEQALLIEAAVRDGRRFDSSAPAGSSYARLRTFLLGDEDVPGAGAGTSEQFATAFVVLARANGLPARVVVGFQPDDQVSPGQWVVRGRDALAWPEVHLDGWGWVRFAPAPDTPDVGLDVPQPEVLDDLGRDTTDAVDEDELTPQPAPSPSPADASPTGEAGGVPAVVGVPALVFVALVVLTPPLLLGLRWSRRGRHRRAGPRGAWSEVLDLTTVYDVPVDRSLPAPELAGVLAHRWPTSDAPHPARRLADAADAATFGPPGIEVDVDWRDLATLRRHAAATQPRWRRVVAAFDPRPLRRR